MKYKGYTIYTTAARLFSDAAVLYLSFLAAFWIRFYSHIFPVYLGIPPIGRYTDGFLAAVVIFLLVFKSFGLYNEKKLHRFSCEACMAVKAVSMGIVIVMALTFMHRKVSYSRLMAVISWVLCTAGIILCRYFIGNMEQWLCSLRREQKKILIIGTGATASALADNIRHSPRWGYEVTGFLSRYDEDAPGQICGVPVLGSIERFSEVLEKKRPDEVILAVSGLSHGKMMRIIVECEKHMVLFKLVPDIFEIVTSRVDIFDIGGVPLLGLRELPLEYAWNRFVKRVMDITGAVLGIAFSLPFYIIIPILIKLTSRGPVFYRQARYGEDGRPFVLCKFRTMRHNAEQETGPVWAEKNDPRCTWIGKYLRAAYLDELPQFINVLKGDMSLVGPRPERPNFVERFKDNIPRYMSRHLIKSGLTGWAQVNGYRGNTPLPERVRYDMYYIENWSFWFDLKIIFMTFLKKKI